LKKIKVYKDASYTSKFFDVLQWWKVEGSKNFEMLASVAIIFLGKPTHNAFQERVFSRGTYCDTKLKKRMKEENFEMSVLNSFNSQRIEEIRNKLSLSQSWNNLGKNSSQQNAVSEIIGEEITTFFKKKNNNRGVGVKENSINLRIEPDENSDTESDGFDTLDSVDDSDISINDFLKSEEYLNDM
jgi:hAT family C-terminal dimerisation region